MVEEIKRTMTKNKLISFEIGEKNPGAFERAVDNDFGKFGSSVGAYFRRIYPDNGFVRESYRVVGLGDVTKRELGQILAAESVRRNILDYIQHNPYPSDDKLEVKVFVNHRGNEFIVG